MDCEGKKVAIVELTRPDKSKASIRMDSPPVKVELKQEEFLPCGRPGSWWVDTFDRLTRSSPFIYPGAEKESPRSSDRKIYANCTNRLLYEDVSYGGPIQLRNAKFTPSDSADIYNFKVTNSQGKTYKETIRREKGQPEPKYIIRCDEDCSEGEIKCPCNRPPGYCCIPCSEFKSGLAAIKGRLK
jgi:hypothetical protein